MHSLNLIHRDIKPDNFSFSINQKNKTLYIFDFGLSKYYRDAKNKIHIPYKELNKLTGTVRYASLNTHKGIEQSRRDDLESALYSIVYMFNGKLPWQGMKDSTNKSKGTKIKEKKEATSSTVLCIGMPSFFQ